MGMNASTIVNDDMTLQEKLDAIAAAMDNVQKLADEEADKKGVPRAPVDPGDAMTCEGCQ